MSRRYRTCTLNTYICPDDITCQSPVITINTQGCTGYTGYTGYTGFTGSTGHTGCTGPAGAGIINNTLEANYGYFPANVVPRTISIDGVNKSLITLYKPLSSDAGIQLYGGGNGGSGYINVYDGNVKMYNSTSLTNPVINMNCLDGNITCNGITGSTGSFSYLTGSTGSFQYINAVNLQTSTFSPSNITCDTITGGTGSFLYLTASNAYITSFKTHNITCQTSTTNISLYSDSTGGLNVGNVNQLGLVNIYGSGNTSDSSKSSNLFTNVVAGNIQIGNNNQTGNVTIYGSASNVLDDESKSNLFTNVLGGQIHIGNSENTGEFNLYGSKSNANYLLGGVTTGDSKILSQVTTGDIEIGSELQTGQFNICGSTSSTNNILFSTTTGNTNMCGNLTTGKLNIGNISSATTLFDSNINIQGGVIKINGGFQRQMYYNSPRYFIDGTTLVQTEISLTSDPYYKYYVCSYTGYLKIPEPDWSLVGIEFCIRMTQGIVSLRTISGNQYFVDLNNTNQHTLNPPNSSNTTRVVCLNMTKSDGGFSPWTIRYMWVQLP